VLSLPLEFSLESEAAPSAARAPLALFLSVIRVEGLGKSTHLGWAQYEPPARAGEICASVHSFRLAMSRSEMLDEAFVGGMQVHIYTETKKQSPNTGARANNNLQK